MPDEYPLLTVEAIGQPAPGARTLVLRPAPGQALHYAAGQYLTLVRQIHGREMRRSYSFSSAPGLGEAPAITVKRVDNGLFSRWLVDDVRVGDVLRTSGTGGFFTLPADAQAYQQLVLLAAGSGITPIFSLLKAALHQQPHLSVLLCYSNRTPAGALFLEELQALARQFAGRLHLELFFSHDPVLYRAHLHRELLEQLVAQYAPAPPARTLAYLCGPLDFMRMGTYGLHEAGLPLAHIRRELFQTGAPAPAPLAPPDMAAHTVTLQLRGQAHRLVVQYPHTILQAAKLAGLRLPYSCEVGQCGNCAARCTQGRVWMKTNEVLTDRELARGLVLTCTGYPVGGDVTLQLD
ncbi:ferredoxin--NADP reductase [Hymenobacter properus]|uniref:Ferredoxin--NADP reductase n=1 Tax=Hymenobacter properus TaxID=2791026 RepID=A0A931BNF4_9BACT|nr:ferredoxin--NADP reductase [Hymenobacter properus]MBF9142630.1 ferredoxin--NADP reductase [Hymenobacter properus]MBR7721438.1 ferredoxin--NADP reductase [Microvirga sp. SRT04]